MTTLEEMTPTLATRYGLPTATLSAPPWTVPDESQIRLVSRQHAR